MGPHPATAPPPGPGRRSAAGLALLLAAALAALLLAACSDDDGTADPPVPADDPAVAVDVVEACLPPPGPEVVLRAVGGELEASAPAGGPLEVELVGDALGQRGLAALVEALAAHDRAVHIAVPDGAGPHPVLVEFHGYSGSAAQMLRYSRFSEVAVDAGYLVVAIDGREQPRRWELTATSPDPAAMGASDVAVVDGTLDVVLASFCGDPDQLHAAGMSNGSVFAAVLACHSRHRFDAVGSVAFTTGTAGCDQDRQVATVAVHGTADALVPYSGRDGELIRLVLGWDLEPAEEAMAAKAALNGCDGVEEARLGGDVVERRWTGCEAATVLYRVEGGGHGWPGPGRPSDGLGGSSATIDATQLIVDFFDRN